MRKSYKHTTHVNSFLKKLILWLGEQSEDFCLLNSNKSYYNDFETKYDFLVGIGKKSEFTSYPFCHIDEFIHQRKDWLFGHLGYDLKNSFENLSTSKPSLNEFSNHRFFAPKLVIIGHKESIEFLYHDENFKVTEIKAIIQNIENKKLENLDFSKDWNLTCVSFEKYKKTFDQIQSHIQRGDIYELNYCIHFTDQSDNFNTAMAYLNWNKNNPTPYSAFYKQNNQYMIGSSPERFLLKKGLNLLSQPMKGTAPKSAQNILSKKNMNENVMIVDIVRNDLSKCAVKNSVKVDSLFEVQSFPTVNQLISSISCELEPNTGFSKVISSTFPMGSMTGAPKIKAMQLIDEYENQARNLFSGSVGYIDPEGNFDFNVNIRSLFFNGDTNKMILPVGSAITSQSNAKEEYEECLLKAQSFTKKTKLIDA